MFRKRRSTDESEEEETEIAMPSSPMLADIIKEEILDGEYSREQGDEERMEYPEVGTDTQSKEDNESGEEGENNLKRAASASPSEDEPSAKKRTNEVDKLWKNVHSNPNDFQAWTLLLQHIDQVDIDGEKGIRNDRDELAFDDNSKKEDEEFEWSRDDLIPADPVEGPAVWIQRDLVKQTKTQMKCGKAAGPSGIVAEMLKASCKSDLDSGREAYDGFFARYPYCYGYWKKYADLERRKGTKDTTLKVFNRGLEAIRLSVDLWLHYMEYVTAQYPDDEIYVRQEFERAIDTSGLEFKSDKLWESYINWECAGKRWKNVTQLYERILATPTSKYMHHWQKFQDHVKKHLPSEIVGVDEFLTMRRAVLAELNRSDIETPDEAPPGVEAAPGDEQVGTNVDEETKALQKSIISARQKIHEANVAEVKALWSYEDAIKRPYFHVKPLEKSQLSAWRNYIEYEIKQGREARIRVLFERCLIACALYEEFWMRYVRYLEEVGAGENEIRAVYHRACEIHLRDKFRPHLAWAAFEEENDGSDRALQILADIQERVPGSLEAWMQAAGVERRRNNLTAAKETFVRCLNQCQEREDKDAHSHVSLKFARFYSLFENDEEKAVEILQEAHEYNKSNSSVLLALVDHSLSCNPPKFKQAEQSLREGIESCQSPGTRLMFAHRLFHFMSECGQEANCVSEGLRVLREVQHEVRQMDSAMAETDTSSTTSKPGEASSSGISVIEPRRDKRSSQDKTPSSTVNGTSTTSSQSVNASYQNYQHAGYGNYNQGYTQGYGTSHGYQGWGYPAQQGGYGYGGAQGWGAYGNYYGQR